MTYDIIKLGAKYYPAKFTLEILPQNRYLSRDGMLLSPEEVSIFGQINEGAIIERVVGQGELRMSGEFSGLENFDSLNGGGFDYLGKGFIFTSYSSDGSFEAITRFDG